ncbi:hypothetical protein GCM10011391_32540 [Pullulanibacillus camelliae]|uniref:Uncharacterized protein n=1 Tax=Pullulanibacillus camelliae TaxID=1707096 RepID=A0A8J2YKJ3_9BACL|nr:hypothetical protein GCM10011391_32540 [Pullulanibacillus camelliae]
MIRRGNVWHILSIEHLFPLINRLNLAFLASRKDFSYLTLVERRGLTTVILSFFVLEIL